jgi:hypothetical protein
MKTTTKFFATAFLVLIGQIVFAFNPNKIETNDLVKFRKHIINQIAFPSKISNANGQEVTVYFEINEELKPEICKIETENVEIEKFIRTEFETMKLPETFSNINQAYSIKIKFYQEKAN